MQRPILKWDANWMPTSHIIENYRKWDVTSCLHPIWGLKIPAQHTPKREHGSATYNTM